MAWVIVLGMIKVSLFLAKTFWALGCIQSIEAEALGLLEPICWVREVGLNDASFEVDCLVVVVVIPEGKGGARP